MSFQIETRFGNFSILFLSQLILIILYFLRRKSFILDFYYSIDCFLFFFFSFPFHIYISNCNWIKKCKLQIIFFFCLSEKMTPTTTGFYLRFISTFLSMFSFIFFPFHLNSFTRIIRFDSFYRWLLVGKSVVFVFSILICFHF